MNLIKWPLNIFKLVEVKPFPHELPLKMLFCPEVRKSLLVHSHLPDCPNSWRLFWTLMQPVQDIQATLDSWNISLSFFKFASWQSKLYGVKNQKASLVLNWHSWDLIARKRPRSRWETQNVLQDWSDLIQIWPNEHFISLISIAILLWVSQAWNSSDSAQSGIKCLCVIKMLSPFFWLHTSSVVVW